MTATVQKRSRKPDNAAQTATLEKSLHLTLEDLRWSESRYRKIFEGSHDGLLLLDAEQHLILDMNESLLKMLGYKREQIIGRPISEIYPEKLSEIISLTHTTIHTGEAFQDEFKIQPRKGKPLQANISAYSVDFGGWPSILCIIKDHTEHRETQAEREQLASKLLHSQQTLDSIIKNVPDIIYRLDSEGRITFVSEAVKRYGYEPAELLGKDVLDLVHLTEREQIRYHLREKRTGERGTHGIEFRLLLGDRAGNEFENRNVAVQEPVFLLEAEGLYGKDTSGEEKFLGTQGIARDITERKRASQALRESEEHLRLITDNIPGLVAYVDQDMIYRFANAGYERWFGLKREDIVGKQVKDLLDKQAYKRSLPFIQRALGGEEVEFEGRLQLPDGSPKYFMNHMVPHQTAEGQIEGYFVLVSDITEIKKADEALQDSEERYRRISENTSDYSYSLVVATDGTMAVDWIGGAFEKVTGYTKDFISDLEKWLQVIHPDDMPAIQKATELVLKHQSTIFEYRVRTKSGDERWLQDSTRGVWDDEQQRVVSIIGAVRDITERKEAELALSQELAVIRALAELSNALIKSENTVEDISSLVLEYARALTNSEHGYVSSIDPINRDNVGHTLTQMMPDCAVNADDQRIAFPIGPDGIYPSLWGHALNTGKPFYTNSPMKHASSSGLPEGHVPLKNYMSIPAVVHGEIMGQISLANTPDGYTDTHMMNVKRLADLFGIAVQRKRAEEALRSSEMLYRSLVESTRAVAWELDLASQTFTYISPQVEEITGYSPEQWTDLAFWASILYQDDRDYAISFCETETAKGKDHEFEYRILAADGRILWIKDIVSVVKENGRPVAMRGYLLDITERKLAEDAMRKSEEKFSKLFQTSPNALIISTLEESKILEVNDVGVQAIGLPKEELLNKTALEIGLIDADNRVQLLDAIQERGYYEGIELPVILPNGEQRTGLFSGQLITLGDQECLFQTIVDITERKTAENERVRLESAIEQSSEAIMLLDLDNKLEYVNPAFESMTGYHREEVIGEYPYLLDSGLQEPEFYQNMAEKVSKGESWGGKMTNQRKDGTLFEVDVTISPVRDMSGFTTHFVSVMRDVTREIALEAQLRQAQKMEAIGGLAGGIAHDFNNMLTAIMANSEVMKHQIEDTHPACEVPDEILRISKKAAALTRQLLAFSAKQEFDENPLNLREIIRSSYGMLKRLIREDIHIETEIDPELGLVRVDPNQIEQVIMNLMLNARDAVTDSGTITLAAKNIVFEEGSENLPLNQPPGDYVALMVSDTGTGIAEEDLERIFEPFFTTKASGEGTGLGLATVYGIVQQSGGFINIDTEIGVGTTFYICFPRIDEPEWSEKHDEADSSLLDREATILLVEDEEDLRTIFKSILENAGHHVLDAENGQAALEFSRQYKDSIDLVITDIIMPKLNGIDLVNLLAEERPGTKTIFVSGHPEDSSLAKKLNGIHYVYLEKPYTAAILQEKIKEILEA
jgi:PAS domain S-box-containing protein